MLDKLIEFLLGFIKELLPFIIIKQYEKAVIFRFGKYRKISLPGFHWKIPFFFFYDVYGIAVTTLTLPAQTIITKDGKSVVIKATVKYEIEDLKIFGVQVADAIDALSDTSRGVIFDEIKNLTYIESYQKDINKVINPKIKREAKSWGIKVHKVTITDYSEMMSLRLFNEQSENS